MKHAEIVLRKIESGEDESEVQGLLEQWLREGKMSEKEALTLATDLFTAGVDTVCCSLISYYTFHGTVCLNKVHSVVIMPYEVQCIIHCQISVLLIVDIKPGSILALLYGQEP